MLIIRHKGLGNLQKGILTGGNYAQTNHETKANWVAEGEANFYCIIFCDNYSILHF